MVPGTFAERLNSLIERERERAPHRASWRVMADDVDLSHTYLRQLATGKQANPTMEVLQALAKRFGTAVDYLWSGERRVNEWQTIMDSPEFGDLSRPTRTRGERFQFVVQHLSLKYPGHLSKPDLAAEMGISLESLLDCLAGKWEPTDSQLKVISELSGVPQRWFRFGVVAFTGISSALVDMDPDKLSQYLDALIRAVENDVPPRVLRAAVEAWIASG